MRQSSNINEHVDEPLIPNLSSFLPSSRPLIGLGIINAEMPLCFSCLSVVANTTDDSLSKPLVIQHLVPFIFQEPFSSLAVVDAAPASEPLPGSDKAKQPIFLPS